jgi:hypothetical protein
MRLGSKRGWGISFHAQTSEVQKPPAEVSAQLPEAARASRGTTQEQARQARVLHVLLPPLCADRAHDVAPGQLPVVLDQPEGEAGAEAAYVLQGGVNFLHSPPPSRGCGRGSLNKE